MKGIPLRCRFLLLLPFLLLAHGEEKKPAPPRGFFDVKSTRAAFLLKKYPEMVILDIRTPAEFRKGHLEGAKNLDYYAKDFADRIEKLDRSKAYLVHCASGGRSGRSMKIFRDKKFLSVYHIEDGYKGWTKADLKVVIPKSED